MTLLIGIRCTDGAVIAADSALTFTLGGSQAPTIADSDCKIQIIDDKLIVVGTGQVGLGQRFNWIVEKLWSQRDKSQPVDPVLMGKAVSSAAHQDFQSTGAPNGAFGALLAFPGPQTAEICEFAIQDLQPELKTEGMWYASAGSGQMLADPYLRLMRTVFWQEGPPNLQSGKFAATWVLRHAIDAAPYGLGDPISMAVLEHVESGNGTKEFKARLLPPDELREHEESVLSATEHFRRFEESLLGEEDGASPIPTLEVSSGQVVMSPSATDDRDGEAASSRD